MARIKYCLLYTSFSFEIADDLLPWNNGTFVIDFEKGHCALTDKHPQYHISMSIGTFTTLLLGYKSAEKLLQMGKIQTTYCLLYTSRCV